MSQPEWTGKSLPRPVGSVVHTHVDIFRSKLLPACVSGLGNGLTAGAGCERARGITKLQLVLRIRWLRSSELDHMHGHGVVQDETFKFKRGKLVPSLRPGCTYTVLTTRVTT